MLFGKGRMLLNVGANILKPDGKVWISDDVDRSVLLHELR